MKRPEKPSDFIGVSAKYDENGTMIWAVRQDGGHQMLLDLRGWGAIQNLFIVKGTTQEIDFPAAEKFQDDLGKWITEAINEKLERERA